MSKERSPFSPGRLVPVEYFTGRLDEINRLEKALKQASSGGNQNIFLTGERGIGKSSLASFIRYLALREEYGYISAHCFLGAARSLEEICRLIFQELIRQLPDTDKGLVEKVKNVLSQYIKSLKFGAFGVGIDVEFNRDTETLQDLRLNFLPILQKIFGEIGDSKRAILIIIDDLNGITRNQDFALFLKSLVDALGAQQHRFPLVLMLVGTDERIQDLSLNQPSLSRIFDPVELSLMSDDESSEFFIRAFESVGCTVERDALSILANFSGGLPMLSHEVGDATFWYDEDSKIDQDDAFGGVVDAADNVGRKSLSASVYQAIRSSAYLSILRRIGDMSYTEMEFTRVGMFGEVSDAERRKFDNFVRKMRELGVITSTEQRGVYRFSNQLYRIYIGMRVKVSQSRQA